jgi:hypothetical protein
MVKIILSTLAAVATACGIAMAGDYNHKDWPVRNDGNGIYAFTDAGQAKAVSLCTAFYTADIQEMDKHGNANTAYGQIIRSHEVTMRDAYATAYNGTAAEMDELVKDMIWHFGNAAQYKAFQEFKDSANMACESYALDNGLVTLDYINSFNDTLLGGV